MWRAVGITAATGAVLGGAAGLAAGGGFLVGGACGLAIGLFLGLFGQSAGAAS
jgi:hypothetical protein